MTFKGRITASALAAGSGIAMLGILTAVQGSLLGTSTLILALGLYLLAALPAGWYTGYQYDRLKRESDLDGLTRICNRRFVSRVFPRLSSRAMKVKKRMSVTVIDINDFKLINDDFGHQAGDQVLIMIADTLRNCAAKGEIVARWGGDEFVLLCPYGISQSKESLALTVRKALEKLSLRIGVRVSASIGTAVFPEDGTNLMELLQTADKRMYMDKEQNKSTTYENQHMLQA